MYILTLLTINAIIAVCVIITISFRSILLLLLLSHKFQRIVELLLLLWL